MHAKITSTDVSRKFNECGTAEQQTPTSAESITLMFIRENNLKQQVHILNNQNKWNAA